MCHIRSTADETWRVGGGRDAHHRRFPHVPHQFHQIITMIKWIRTSRLSIKNSLSPTSHTSSGVPLWRVFLVKMCKKLGEKKLHPVGFPRLGFPRELEQARPGFPSTKQGWASDLVSGWWARCPPPPEASATSHTTSGVALCRNPRP